MGAWEWSAFLSGRDPRARGAFVATSRGSVLLGRVARDAARRRGRSRRCSASRSSGGSSRCYGSCSRPRRVRHGRRARRTYLAGAGLARAVRLRARAAEWRRSGCCSHWCSCGWRISVPISVARRFGRLRLAPAVSPGKTWEGALGGLAASAIVAVMRRRLVSAAARRSSWCSAWPAVAFSIVGDLTESLLKRFAGVKDSGTLFPGHGGVMDRIDSVTGAVPVLLLGLTFLESCHDRCGRLGFHRLDRREHARCAGASSGPLQAGCARRQPQCRQAGGADPSLSARVCGNGRRGSGARARHGAGRHRARDPCSRRCRTHSRSSRPCPKQIASWPPSSALRDCTRRSPPRVPASACCSRTRNRSSCRDRCS